MEAASFITEISITIIGGFQMYRSISIYHLYEVTEVIGELFRAAWVFAFEGGKGLLEGLALWMV